MALGGGPPPLETPLPAVPVLGGPPPLDVPFPDPPPLGWVGGGEVGWVATGVGRGVGGGVGRGVGVGVGFGWDETIGAEETGEPDPALEVERLVTGLETCVDPTVAAGLAGA